MAAIEAELASIHPQYKGRGFRVDHTGTGKWQPDIFLVLLYYVFLRKFERMIKKRLKNIFI